MTLKVLSLIHVGDRHVGMLIVLILLGMTSIQVGLVGGRHVLVLIARVGAEHGGQNSRERRTGLLPRRVDSLRLVMYRRRHRVL